MKMTGAEFMAWQNADWGHADAHWDDFVLMINGIEVDDYDKIEAADSIEVHDGIVMLGGGRGEMSVEDHFNAWKKAQTTTTTTIVVEVAKEREQELRNMLMTFGATIAK